MKINRLLACLIAASALGAQAYPGFLEKAEKSISKHTAVCPRDITPDTMAECARKANEKEAAENRYRKQEIERSRAGEPQFNFDKAAPAKPSRLCFIRKATGEMVCPN